MANLVITKTAYTAKVEFNDFSEATGFKEINFRRNEISEIQEAHGADHITVVMLDGNDFDVSYASHKYALVIDSVDGTAPTDNDHLTTLLEALQQV